MKFCDLTFVVQGAWTNKTATLLQQLSLSLPLSPIILSTWDHKEIPAVHPNTRISNIINEDPGLFTITSIDGDVIRHENINRQIISTVAGLNSCKTEYAFKLRSDFELHPPKLLRELSKRSTELESGKLIISTMNTISPLAYPGYCFHFSDWFILGKTRLIIESISSELIPSEPPINIVSNKWSRASFPIAKYSCEQFFYGPLRLKYTEYNKLYPCRVINTYRLIMDRLIILNPDRLGLGLEHYKEIINKHSVRGIIFSLSTVPEYDSCTLLGKINFYLAVLVKAPLSYLSAFYFFLRTFAKN